MIMETAVNINQIVKEIENHDVDTYISKERESWD
jgi:hypothetical protein